MNIDDIAGRIPSLSAGLIKILASMSEGMSNGQNAERLGYKNASIVSTYISLINKQLCLTSVDSRIEKRQIAIDAFKSQERRRHDSDISFPTNNWRDSTKLGIRRSNNIATHDRLRVNFDRNGIPQISASR
jgi:hypothetical protein